VLKKFLTVITESGAVGRVYAALFGWVCMDWLPCKFGVWTVRAHSLDRWLAVLLADAGSICSEYKNIVRSGDCIADVGANIGLHTLILAGLVGDKGKVVVFEPHQKNFESLKNNISENGFNDRVDCVNGAASDVSCKKKLYVSRHNNGDHHFYHGENTDLSVEVSVSRLDDRPEHFNVIKIDVQGHEMAVLNGGIEKLKHESCRAVIVEISPKKLQEEQTTPAKIEGFMKTLGFFPSNKTKVEEEYYDIVFEKISVAKNCVGQD